MRVVRVLCGHTRFFVPFVVLHPYLPGAHITIIAKVGPTVKRAMSGKGNREASRNDNSSPSLNFAFLNAIFGLRCSRLRVTRAMRRPLLEIPLVVLKNSDRIG